MNMFLWFLSPFRRSENTTSSSSSSVNNNNNNKHMPQWSYCSKSEVWGWIIQWVYLICIHFHSIPMYVLWMLENHHSFYSLSIRCWNDSFNYFSQNHALTHKHTYTNEHIHAHPSRRDKEWYKGGEWLFFWQGQRIKKYLIYFLTCD
jgi:hypothetical protein